MTSPTTEEEAATSRSGINRVLAMYGPAVFAGAFGFFIGPHAPLRLPGVAFLVAALMLAIAAFVAWRFTDAAHLPAQAAPAADKPEAEPAG
mgnify:CR=1 FL=1